MKWLGSLPNNHSIKESRSAITGFGGAESWPGGPGRRNATNEAASGIMIGVKLVFLLALAAVSVAAPPRLEHGHKLGSSVAYLEDSGDVRDGTPLSAFLTDSAGKPSPVQIVIQRADGSAASIVAGPSGAQRPCAVFEAWAEQTTSDFAESAGTGVKGIVRTAGKMVMQRFVRDDLRQIYASYTVTVERLPEGTYRVSFGPPEPPADMLGKEGWKIFSPAKYPAPQIVRNEDSIRMELYSNGTTTGTATRRVVDYIHVGRQDRMVMRTDTPHDSYADDAELAVTQPRFRVNGAVLPRDAVVGMPETIRGPVLWVYIPGYGRYVLSLAAHADLGFESAGEAAGNSLTFTADGNIFRVETAERVAAGSGTYTVYMLADRGWEPADPQDRARVMVGASIGVIGPGAIRPGVAAGR